MAEYEALLIISPQKEASLKEITHAITAGITKAKGKVKKEENWGKQRIAYPVRKEREGIFYKLDFEIEPGQIAGLKKNYRLNPDILRVAITKK